jgi:hypothetical protein
MLWFTQPVRGVVFRFRITWRNERGGGKEEDGDIVLASLNEEMEMTSYLEINFGHNFSKQNTNAGSDM